MLTACALCRYSGLTFAKNSVSVLTGILTGVVCVGITRVVEVLVDWRNTNMATLLKTHDAYMPAFGLVLGYGLTLTTIAACMVRSWLLDVPRVVATAFDCAASFDQFENDPVATPSLRVRDPDLDETQTLS